MEKHTKKRTSWVETSQQAGIFIHQSIPKGVDWCVLALGSLARFELTKQSDLDILVIVLKEKDTYEVSSWLHYLMDHYPSVCAVVRSKAECLDMLHEDFRSWIGIIEARPIGGNMQHWYSLRKALARQVSEVSRPHWKEKLRRSIESRHERYGRSVRLLEPNIKNSAGGLRDIHTIYWFTLLDAYRDITQSCSDFTPRFSTVLKRSPIHERRQQIISNAREFYLSVRFAMHDLTGMLQDYLDYDLQQQVAVKLGYGSQQAKEAVEIFMYEYLRNAREVHLTLEKLFPPAPEQRSIVVSIEGVTEEKGVLSVKDAGVKIDNRFIADVFEYAQGKPGVIGEEITRRIDIEVTQKKILPDEFSNAFLHKLFTSTERIADILMHLNNRNILGSWIPEFGKLVSFFQHNIYHYYTADEHTLLALKACEKLEEKEGYIADVYRRQDDKTNIKLGIFFHDVAKPISVDDHEKKGIDIVRRVLPRLGLEQYVDDTVFIVRYHLLMEQVAFRRDFHDEATVRDFVVKVQKPERLDWLLIMTYADLCAVNPKVWTPWKEQLLCELHSFALNKMKSGEESKHDNREGVERTVVKRERAEVKRRPLNNGEVIEVLFHHDRSHTKVTVITRDRPYLLSSICAALTYQDCNIIDAKIETNDSGIAEDAFRVVDIVEEGPLREEQVEGIVKTLADVLMEKKNAPDLISKHREKWKRRLRKTSNVSVRTDVEFHEHPSGEKRGTIVEVYSHDTIGLLYTIARILADFNLDITVAKIATRVDGVVDSFYVMDKSSQLLSNTVKGQLKKALLESLESMNVVNNTR